MEISKRNLPFPLLVMLIVEYRATYMRRPFSASRCVGISPFFFSVAAGRASSRASSTLTEDRDSAGGINWSASILIIPPSYNDFSVTDRDRFNADPNPDPICNLNADPNPDPTFNFDADLDLTFNFYADPDPTFNFDADPSPDPTFNSDADPYRILLNMYM
jgi:hypothetical protein